MTSPLEGKKFLILQTRAVAKEFRITSKAAAKAEKRLRWSFIPLHECGKLIVYGDEGRSINQQTCETKFAQSKIPCPPPVR